MNVDNDGQCSFAPGLATTEMVVATLALNPHTHHGIDGDRVPVLDPGARESPGRFLGRTRGKPELGQI